MNEKDRRLSKSGDYNPCPDDRRTEWSAAYANGRNGEQDFRFLAENARDAIAVIARNGAFLYVNQRGYELTGYSDTDRKRIRLADLVSKEEMDRVFALRAARHAGQNVPERYETSILDRNDQRIPVEITVAATTWKGQPADVVILRDISERKRAEKELRQREAVLETINFATEVFLSSPSWENRINEVLAHLGRAMEVSRVGLTELEFGPKDELITTRRSGWVDPVHGGQDAGILDGMLQVSQHELRPLLAKLKQVQVIHGPAQELTDQIRMTLERHGIRSVLCAPIVIDETLWGLLGVSDRTTERTWSALEVDALMAAASILGGLIRRQKLEETLRESETKYRSLVEAADLSIVTIDRDGIFRFANNRAARGLGLPPDEIVGKTMWDLFPREFADRQMESLRRALDGKTLEVLDTLTVIQGRETWREVRIQPLILSGDSCNLGMVIVNDITERKEAEERIYSYQSRLRSLTSDLLLTEQRERRRIAEALHDRIGQALAISKIKLGDLMHESTDGSIENALREVRSLIDQTIEDTRSLTFDLSPPILHELGLEPAIEWLVERLRERHGIEATFKNDGKSAPLGDDCRILLFQSVQELLVNVMRHAQARWVEVSIRHEGDEILIETRDDGIGFEAGQIGCADGSPQGFGLFSIRERLNSLGGELQIDSGPGRGSRITLRAPRLGYTRPREEEGL